MPTRGQRCLQDFLRRTELTHVELARLASITPMQVSHLAAGRRRPSLDTAFVLERITGKRVPAKAWTETA